MASILRVDQLQNKNGEPVMTLSGSTIEFAGGFTPSSVVVPTWTTSTRPSSGINIGYMGLNTETSLLEVYNGTNPVSGDPSWSSMGGSVSGLPFNLYDDSSFGSFISYMTNLKTTWAASGTNFQYSTDSGNADRIQDAQSDMYDGGNYTQVRVNGSGSSNINYNAQPANYNNVKYAPLGYSWPLVAIAVAEDGQDVRYGFSRSGNLGADGGGGSVGAITVYDNSTVEGFSPVYAWLVNKAWNQNSDPGIMHLYVTVGSPQWQSNVSNGFTVNNFASSSDNDQSQYESTSRNCFVWTALVSNGQTQGAMTQSQARTFVQNFLSDARSHFGL
tara:strand:+ start:27907 stop:28896 length:990 start_codon:yes stop_codon:yes gene_type:complete